MCIAGEFGIVYKGHIVKDQGKVVTEVVAIKTLKGTCMHNMHNTITFSYSFQLNWNCIIILNPLRLIGFYDKTTVRDMLKECSKVVKFDHPNVLTLIGVCLDGGPAPFIIMPFMTNGSLLTYLKNNRESLIVSHENEDDENVHELQRNVLI